MSAYLGSGYRPDYRRDWDEDDRSRGRDRDRGRRQGDHSRYSSDSSDRVPLSPRAPRRSRSPRKAKTGHDLRTSVSPPHQVPRTPASVDARSLIAKPSNTKDETVSDPKTAHPMSTVAGQETRDPRLLSRINTATSLATTNISASPGGESSNMPLTAIVDRATNQSHNYVSHSINQKNAQVFSPTSQSLSPATSTIAVAQSTESATAFATLLGTLFENSSNSAALRYEHSKIKAKATQQASLDKKMGDSSKAFPAYAETSSKAKRDTEKDLAIVDQKLAELRKSQADVLSAMPNIFQTSMASDMTKKEQEQRELVQRCMSIYNDFKSNVSDVKQGFEKHKSATSNLEEDYKKMDGQVNSLESQLADLSSKLQSSQARSSALEEKQKEMQKEIRSFHGEANSSLAAIKNNLKQQTEQRQQQKSAIQTIADEAGNILGRLNLLESRNHTFIESQSLQAKKTEELKKIADMHSDEMKRTASFNLKHVNTINSMKQELSTLRQSLTDAQAKESSTSINAEEISTLKADVAALKTELIELAKAKSNIQNPTLLKPELSGNDEDGRDKGRLENGGVEERLKNCLGEIEDIRERLDAKQIEEDQRDDIIAGKVDEVKMSLQQAQGELGRRIGDLERDFQKQRVEHIDKMQKLHDSISQLGKAGSQLPNNRVSPPSAAPTPQMRQGPQLQGTSNSALLTASPISGDINRKLASVETFLLGVGQQIQAITIAWQQLDHRYNNLSTEPVVRAMVHQMQLMYPYASEAQREISNLKQLIEPLKTVPLQMEVLKGVVEEHKDDFAKILGFESRIDALEEEKAKNEAKQERLVAHVKEERGKLVDEVKTQKETVETLAKEVDRLEEYRKGEPDRLEYVTEKVAKKLQTESAKAMESVERRLDALEGDSTQGLLGAFTSKNPASKINDHIRDLQNVDSEDDVSLPIVVKTDGSTSSKPSQSSIPSGICKTSLKPKTLPKTKKRKRFGSLDNNDRSDDENWTPSIQSSPTRRRLRG